MCAGVFGTWTVTFFYMKSLVFQPSPALLGGVNGNPATGFANQDGRVSNGAMATGVSIRRVSRPLGGRRAFRESPLRYG